MEMEDLAAGLENYDSAALDVRRHSMIPFVSRTIPNLTGSEASSELYNTDEPFRGPYCNTWYDSGEESLEIYAVANMGLSNPQCIEVEGILSPSVRSLKKAEESREQHLLAEH